MTRLTTLDLPNFHRATIRFDRLFDEMEARLQIAHQMVTLHTTLHKSTKTSI